MNATHRIALREEGSLVNMYWAKIDTMEGAILIGSLHAAVCADDEIFEQYKALGKNVAVLLSRLQGQDPIGVREQNPPEHEAKGHA